MRVFMMRYSSRLIIYRRRTAIHNKLHIIRLDSLSPWECLDTMHTSEFWKLQL